MYGDIKTSSSIKKIDSSNLRAAISDQLKQSPCLTCIHRKMDKDICLDFPECPLHTEKEPVSCFIDTGCQEGGALSRGITKKHPPKICPVCGKEFYKPVWMGLERWLGQKTCSRPCANIHRSRDHHKKCSKRNQNILNEYDALMLEMDKHSASTRLGAKYNRSPGTICAIVYKERSKRRLRNEQNNRIR